MGRGVMTHPAAVATVYRTLSNLHTYCMDCDIEVDADECPECGAEMYDHDGEVARDEFEYLVEWIREAFGERFPSMYECDRWAHGCGAMDELHCIMANELCDVYISEYCSMVAISVVPTGCDEYDVNTTGLATRWAELNASVVLERFNEYSRIATMSNGEQVYRRV